MLMAGVLNSEVEKICPASYRARRRVQSPRCNSRQTARNYLQWRRSVTPSIL
jgi:hypothetical protein